MSKIPSNRRQRGFSLLEVLVAVVILSFGLLALATLQVSLLRSSSDTKARTVALALAKDTLEARRNFNSLTGYQALTDGTGSAQTIGGIAYTPAWTVERFVYNQDVDADGTLNETNDQQFQLITPDTGATPTSPAGLVSNNEFKRLKVTVTWTDSQNVGQSVALEDAVAALSPTDSALVSKQTLTTGTRRIPAIINDPALDSMVIPIALGGGVNSAASNPKPQIVINNSTVETQFDVYTYSNLNGGTALAQARVETIMVGCTCDFGNGGGANNQRPTYWDGFRYTVPVPATYTAPAGVKASEVNNQSSRCNICCRDHHAPNGTTGATFSPRLVTKNSSDTVTAYHPHWLDKNALTPTTTGAYKEACRLIRVDGVWRVAADLEDDYFGLLATGNGTTALTPTPDTTTALGSPTITGGAFARYQQFVLGYLKGRYVDPTPSDSAAQSTYNTVGTPATLAASAAYVLDSPSNIDIALVDSTGKWLHSRGLYIDYLELEAVDAIKQKKIDSTCTVDAATLQTCVLKLLPFTSINLTEIADWGPISGSFVVTNLDYSTSLASGNPVRGKVTTNASAAAAATATTYARKYNSSLLDLSFDSISPTDDVKSTDTQAFSIAGGAGGGGPGDGTINVTMPSYASNGGTNTPATSWFVTGAGSTVSCGYTPATKIYACNVDGNGSTSGLDVVGGVAFDVGLYNHQQATANQTSPILTGCVSTEGLAGVLNSNQATDDPGTPQPYAGSVCKNYAITSVTAPVNAGAATIAPAPSSAGDGRVLPVPGEVTRISFPSGYLSAGQSITVVFGAPVSTPQVASSCTYTCGQIQGGACKSNKPTTFTAIFPACP